MVTQAIKKADLPNARLIVFALSCLSEKEYLPAKTGGPAIKNYFSYCQHNSRPNDAWRKKRVCYKSNNCKEKE